MLSNQYKWVSLILRLTFIVWCGVFILSCSNTQKVKNVCFCPKNLIPDSSIRVTTKSVEYWMSKKKIAYKDTLNCSCSIHKPYIKWFGETTLPKDSAFMRSGAGGEVIIRKCQ